MFVQRLMIRYCQKLFISCSMVCLRVYVLMYRMVCTWSVALIPGPSTAVCTVVFGGWRSGGARCLRTRAGVSTVARGKLNIWQGQTRIYRTGAGMCRWLKTHWENFQDFFLSHSIIRDKPHPGYHVIDPRYSRSVSVHCQTKGLTRSLKYESCLHYMHHIADIIDNCMCVTFILFYRISSVDKPLLPFFKVVTILIVSNYFFSLVTVLFHSYYFVILYTAPLCSGRCFAVSLFCTLTRKIWILWGSWLTTKE